jgi:hypothetical protein
MQRPTAMSQNKTAAETDDCPADRGEIGGVRADIAIYSNAGHVMSAYVVLSISIASSLALISLGGGLYEFLVVDPHWPRRPDIIQPDRGGISRKMFWIPAHTMFELALIGALVIAWSLSEVRFWLVVALISHALMRVWSLIDFVPKALAFERADPATITESAARRWTRRSLWRLPFDIVTCASILAALIAAVQSS